MSKDIFSAIAFLLCVCVCLWERERERECVPGFSLNIYTPIMEIKFIRQHKRRDLPGSILNRINPRVNQLHSCSSACVRSIYTSQGSERKWFICQFYAFCTRLRWVILLNSLNIPERCRMHFSHPHQTPKYGAQEDESVFQASFVHSWQDNHHFKPFKHPSAKTASLKISPLPLSLSFIFIYIYIPLLLPLALSLFLSLTRSLSVSLPSSWRQLPSVRINRGPRGERELIDVALKRCRYATLMSYWVKAPHPVGELWDCCCGWP